MTNLKALGLASSLLLMSLAMVDPNAFGMIGSF